MTQAYNLSQLANFVNTSGQLDALLGLSNTSSLGFPSGTRMSFNQTAAPTGWTKDTATAINDSLLRLVTGSVSSGGLTAFSTFNSASSTGATTLTTSQIPTQGYQVYRATASGTNNNTFGSGIGGLSNGAISASWQNTYSSNSVGAFRDTNTGGSHTHTFSANIKYTDFIVATKN